jgi:predicted RNase H-like HicB family nuclease
MKPQDNYPIVVFWSEGDEAYIADVPDLRYCSAHGETPEEALREALIARELWLRVAREDGLALPDPKTSPYLPEIARQTNAVPAAVS